MGKPYPQVIRENVLDLHNNGLSIRQISAQARVSTGFITKVIKEYNENNYSVPRRALSRGGSRGRVEGVATPPLGSFQTGYPCVSLFHTKNNIISYNISSSPIDHYKKTVAIPLLDSLIIQMQDRLCDEDRPPPPPSALSRAIDYSE